MADDSEVDPQAEALREEIDKLVVAWTADIKDDKEKHVLPMIALSDAMADAGARFIARGGRMEPEPLMVATLIRTSPWMRAATEAVARWKEKHRGGV